MRHPRPRPDADDAGGERVVQLIKLGGLSLCGLLLLVVGYVAGARSPSFGGSSLSSSTALLRAATCNATALRQVEQLGAELEELRARGGADAVMPDATARAAACEVLASRYLEAPACSYAFYDDYYACYGGNPAAGAWEGTAWKPSACTLPSWGGGCLWERGDGAHPRTILLLGGSQALRTMRGIERSMPFLGISCLQEAEEGAYTLACTGANGVLVRLQYLGSCSSEPEPCRSAWSTQLALFDAYRLAHPQSYPDEIHIMQGGSDCAGRTAADLTRDLRWLLQLIEGSAPARTRVHHWEATGSASDALGACAQVLNGVLQRELAPYMAKPEGALGPRWRAVAGSYVMSSMVSDADYVFDNVARMVMGSYCGG